MQWSLLLFVLLSNVSHLTSESTPSTDHQFLTQVLRDEDLGLALECRSSLGQLLFSLLRGQEWAKKMSASVRHRPPDVRSGQLADFGDFDSCIGIQQQEFQGKYCLYRQHFNFAHASTINLMASKPAGFRDIFHLETVAGSICMPSSCSDREVEAIIQKYLAAEGTRIEIRAGCETSDRIHSPDQANEESVFQWIFILWVVFIFLATCLAPTLESEFLKCFSVTENTSQILKRETSSSNSAGREYEFLYGYRFLYLIIASCMHIFELQIFWSPLAVINIANYHSNHSWMMKMMAGHFSHSMGSNFVWAGFLSFAGRLNELKKNKKFDLVKGFSNRILRTIPTIIGCYLMILSFPRSLVSGPVFRESFSLIRNNSIHQFWTELTFSQNLLYPNETALMPSWIISSDIQLFAASFFLIYLYHKNPLMAKILLVCLTILSCFAQAIYLVVNDYPAYLDFSSYDLKSIITNSGLHVSTINYVSSYLIGMIVAILIHERFRVRRKSVKAGVATVFIAFYVGTFAVPYTWKHRTVSRVEELIYGSLYRSLTAAAIAGSVYWHVTVNDFMRKLFAARIFVVLGRFNYSIYMAHFLFIYLDIFTTRRPIDYDSYSMAIRTSYVVFYGIVLGYMTHLLFEAPFVRLSRWIFAPAAKPVPSIGSGSNSPIKSSDQNNNSSQRGKSDPYTKED